MQIIIDLFLLYDYILFHSLNCNLNKIPLMIKQISNINTKEVLRNGRAAMIVVGSS